MAELPHLVPLHPGLGKAILGIPQNEGLPLTSLDASVARWAVKHLATSGAQSGFGLLSTDKRESALLGGREESVELSLHSRGSTLCG